MIDYQVELLKDAIRSLQHEYFLILIGVNLIGIGLAIAVALYMAIWLNKSTVKHLIEIKSIFHVITEKTVRETPELVTLATELVEYDYLS